jgi:hypothetical protein
MRVVPSVARAHHGATQRSALVLPVATTWMGSRCAPGPSSDVCACAAYAGTRGSVRLTASTARGPAASCAASAAATMLSSR